MRPPTPDDTGLRWETAEGLPIRVISADGTVLVRAADDGGGLRLRRPDGGEISLRFDAADHPVLGRCDAIEDEHGRRLALASRVDWAEPDHIPAVDRPGALPRGAGTAILNLLAWQAHRCGRGPLRYRGPYPTAALWNSLQASFRVDPGQDPARFVDGAEARAIAGTHDEIAIDFHPDPHAWRWPRPRVCVQQRRGAVERVYVEGLAFDRSTVGPRRLIDRDGRLWATVMLGNERWCDRLALDLTGEPQGDILPLPSPPADVVGTELPEPVVQVLGEVLGARAPRLLQPALRSVLEDTRMRWGDPGAELVVWRDGVLSLHAGMLVALPTDSTALLGVLIQLIEGPLQRVATRTLAEAWSRHTTTP